MPRGADGSLSGAQCLMGALDLYSSAGAIRLQLIALQAAVREQQALSEEHR